MIIDRMADVDTFSVREKEIIDYIIANSEDFVAMTIDKLAKATFTSNGTIIRLCRKLGFSGYREFRMQFVKELESKKYRRETVDFSSPFYPLQDTNQIIQNMTSLYRESLDLCVFMMDSRVLNRITDEIIKSSHLFILAMGDTMLTAKLFINKLAKINIYPILATENHEEYTICSHSGRDDCALFISYSGGSNPSYDKIVKRLKKNGTNIITITANENSNLARYSNHLLLVEDKEKSNRIAAFYSQFVFEYILNIIYSLIYAKNYEENRKS